jgi:hypothetical protein
MILLILLHQINSFDGPQEVLNIKKDMNFNYSKYIDSQIIIWSPSWMNTESVYTCKRSCTIHISPYMAVLHDSLLRSYISVTIYRAIRSYMEKNEQNADCIYSSQTSTVVNDRIFLVYGRVRSFTESVTFELGMASMYEGNKRTSFSP